MSHKSVNYMYIFHFDVSLCNWYLFFFFKCILLSYNTSWPQPPLPLLLPVPPPTSPLPQIPSGKSRPPRDMWALWLSLQSTWATMSPAWLMSVGCVLSMSLTPLGPTVLPHSLLQGSWSKTCKHTNSWEMQTIFKPHEQAIIRTHCLAAGS